VTAIGKLRDTADCGRKRRLASIGWMTALAAESYDGLTQFLESRIKC